MKVMTSCWHCFEMAGTPRFATFAMRPVNEKGIIEFECDYGHKCAQIVQERRFEIASSIAIEALSQGRCFDSIKWFATALERLYEFYVEIAYRRSGADGDTVNNVWKLLSQTERQLGAFVSCHLMSEGQPPSLLSQKMTKLRNDVVHKGYLATHREAMEFGQAVIDCAVPLLRRLKSDGFQTAVRESTVDFIAARSKLARQLGAKIAVGVSATPFSLTQQDTETSLDRMLQREKTMIALDGSLAQISAITP